MHFKEQIGIKYAELVYYGLWFTPLREALDAFVNQTQTEITGSVSLSLYKGNVAITGRQSEYSLYNTDLAAFTMGDGYDQKDAAGFIRILGLPARSRARARTPQQTSIGFPPQAATVRQNRADGEPGSGFVGDTGFAGDPAEVTQ